MVTHAHELSNIRVGAVERIKQLARNDAYAMHIYAWHAHEYLRAAAEAILCGYTTFPHTIKLIQQVEAYAAGLRVETPDMLKPPTNGRNALPQAGGYPI